MSFVIVLLSYEPELAPGLNFKAEKDSSTSLKLFSTGRIVIMGKTCPWVNNIVCVRYAPLNGLHVLWHVVS